MLDEVTVEGDSGVIDLKAFAEADNSRLYVVGVNASSQQVQPTFRLGAQPAGGAAGHRFPWSDANTIQHARANYISDDYYPYDTSETRGLHPEFCMGLSPHTNPVDYFAPNDYGLHDMSGNLWEWCHDWYLSTYYASSPYNNPHGPATAQRSRVLRGGSWSASVHYCRVSARTFLGHVPGYRYDHTGFRLVLDAP